MSTAGQTCGLWGERKSGVAHYIFVQFFFWEDFSREAGAGRFQVQPISRRRAVLELELPKTALNVPVPRGSFQLLILPVGRRRLGA